jgi:hypothetical protein
VFPSQAVFTAANLETLSMPKDSKTGKLLLKAVKREQTERQAARTALALVRCESSSVDPSLSQGIPEPVPAPEEEVLWVRHVFDSGNLLVFARGEKEAITIRKSPEGPGWYIDFGGAVISQPK